MRQYSTLKFISLLLLLSLVFGCNTFNKKIYKESNIVGATVDDHNASVEIREELDEKGDLIKKTIITHITLRREGSQISFRPFITRRKT